MAELKGLVHSLHELEEYYKGAHTGDIIELMNKTDDILTDIPWMETNESGGHKTRIRNGLPDVYWGRLYKGTPPSKSKFTQVVDPTGFIESRFFLDAREAALYGDKAKDFRVSEQGTHMEAIRQEVATTLFYGDSDTEPDKFNGLHKRYPADDAPNVIDAGGTSGSMTSIWLIAWGPNTVHGLYPKGSKAGIEHDDRGIQTVPDDAGRRYEAYEDVHRWHVGLSVRDWRAVVRICNIPVAYLTEDYGDTNYVNLRKLCIKAKNKMPSHMRNKAVWYCNEDVMTAIETQSTDPKGVHLRYGEYFNSKDVPFVHGRPVRQCDSILSTETVI